MEILYSKENAQKIYEFYKESIIGLPIEKSTMAKITHLKIEDYTNGMFRVFAVANYKGQLIKDDAEKSAKLNNLPLQDKILKD